jgi:uncharacterized protein
LSGPKPWSAAAGGITLSVRLTPKGGRDSIDGVQLMADGRSVLKVRVRAAPIEGEANDALLRVIARTVGVPPRDVTLAAGASARIKQLAILGEGPTLIAVLEKICASR